MVKIKVGTWGYSVTFGVDHEIFTDSVAKEFRDFWGEVL